MKKFISAIFLLCLAFYAHAGDSVTGFWQTIDDETGKPKSIVSVYEQEGQVFGKILVTYQEDGTLNAVKTAQGLTICNTAKLAEKMPGKPTYCGLMIIKDLKLAKDGKYTGGTITDPKKGKTYRAEMWRDGDALIVRGKLGPFGRNQTWLAFDAKTLPAGIVLAVP